MSEKLKLELNLTTPAPLDFDMRKLIGNAIEQTAVNIRDGHASGQITIGGKEVGMYIITKHAVRQEVRGWSGVSLESAADQFVEDMMDQQMRP